MNAPRLIPTEADKRPAPGLSRANIPGPSRPNANATNYADGQTPKKRGRPSKKRNYIAFFGNAEDEF
uniref:Uncharacterized protein n=1 Tax=Panagrolaimus davidi TaxID=227884 RepID=A0A914R369_9BILA